MVLLMSRGAGIMDRNEHDHVPEEARTRFLGGNVGTHVKESFVAAFAPAL